jgi:hypothetical protein
MNDLDKIKKILELKTNYQKLEQCYACGSKTKFCYFYSKGMANNGMMLCEQCNQLQISEEDVRGNYQLEYLHKKVYRK